MNFLKQSTSTTLKMGPFIDDTDFKTAETGLSIAQADVRLSKNGGDYAQKNDSGSATHDELGEYDVPVNATDTGTAGRLRVIIAKSGALVVWKDFEVLTADAYDAMISGSGNGVRSNVQALAAGVITTAACADAFLTNAKVADAFLSAAKLAADTLTAAKIHSDVTTEITAGLATAADWTAVMNVISALVAAMNAGAPFMRAGTAQAGSATSLTLDAGASATDGFYTGMMLVLYGGTGAGQAQYISGYVGSTKVAAVPANWIVTPDNTTQFTVLPRIKHPNLDVAVSTRATPSDVLAQALAALNSAVPGSPTADSINERVKTFDDAYTAAKAAFLDVAIGSRAAPGAAMTLTTGERDAIAVALLGLADGIETNFTLKQTLRIIAAAVAGKSSGDPGSPVFKNLGDTANRISATVDVNGNRTAVSHTP